MFPKSRYSQQDRKDLQKCLMKFYTESASPWFDPRLDQLREIVYQIVKRVQQKDKRFSFDVHDVGSIASRVSAVVACEFDILLCLEVEGTDEESELSPGYAKFKLSHSSQQLWPDACKDGYLHPRKVTDIFQSHVDDVVRHMTELRGLFSVGGQGTVATTVAKQELDYKFKADLVIAVKCHGWPSSANADWLQPGYERPWPSQEAISAIKKNGYELVAKYVNSSTPGIGDSGPDLERLWRLSVSRSETLLLKTMDPPDKDLCRKMCLIILKALRLHQLVQSQTTRPDPETTITFTSYHLKTLLFHECQRFPNDVDWTTEKLADRFLSFVDNLHWRVNFEDLSPFFFPGINLFKNRGITFGGTWKSFFFGIRDNPKAFLQAATPIHQYDRFRYSYY